MNIVRKLLRLARALDWAKDPDPDHWKTINGAKVHLDADGNYDGGAGGRFNGKHHYGPGYKEKQNTPKRRPASEIVLGARKPNVKGLSESALRERMKKANNYGDWNRAQGEIYRRLRQKERDLKMQFNAAYGKPKQKEIGEVLRKHQALLEQFRQEAKIPYKFIEESFNNDPEAARKAYEGKQFWNSAFYPAYEKWKAKKERTSSIMQNLANSLKGTSNGTSTEVEKLTAQINELSSKQKELLNQANKIYRKYYSGAMFWTGNENKEAEYHNLMREANGLKRKAAELAVKRGQLKSKTDTHQKPFVNGYGEATQREITNPTYERKQRELSKQISSFVGGNYHR